MWSSDKWEPGEKSLIKTWEFHKGLLLHGDKILFLSLSYECVRADYVKRYLHA